MNKFVVSASAAGVLAAIVIACTGDPGPAGTNGTNGTSGQPGATGSNGATGAQGPNGTAGQAGANGAAGAAGPAGEAGAPGGTVILSSRAKKGLDISPVAVNTAGLSADQIEQIGQGSYIVNAIADCNGCHTSPQGKFLAGNTEFDIGGANKVFTRNLTPDPTTGLTLTESEFVTVLRTGKDFKNSPSDAGTDVSLIVMPWTTFRWMSTADIKAIYAYLKAIPAVQNTISADVKPSVPPYPFPSQYNEGAVPRDLPPEFDVQNNPIPDPNDVLRGLAVVPLDIAPPTDATDVDAYARGSYLVNAVAGCNDCHTNPSRALSPPFTITTGEFLTGGAIFATPPPLQPLLRTTRAMSANLLGRTGGFFAGATFAQFLATITQGVHGDDPPPQAPLAFPMPWQTFRNMELADLTAVYTYMTWTRSNTDLPNKAIRDTALYCDSTDPDAGVTCPSTMTCDTTNKECVGLSCQTNDDCPVCQTCTAAGNTKCALPSADLVAACVASGI